MITIWILIFVVSLSALILAADIFTQRSERIALAFGISPFVIGITLVAFGTSVPELATGIVAMFQGAPSVPIANAIGSNIANILLVLGISAVAVKTLKAERNLIDIDLPLFFGSTMLLMLILLDRAVSFTEGLLLIIGYNVYIAYAYTSGSEKKEALAEAVETKKHHKHRIDTLSVVLIFVSIAVIYVSADFTVRSIIEIASALNIPRSAIAITAIALGTSLPELVISLRAALKGKHDLAIGNIMGSNIFNLLVIVGVPSLIGTLVVDDLIWKVGIPFLLAATLIIIFSGITRRVYRWEGAMYLVIYILFLLKIFEFSA